MWRRRHGEAEAARRGARRRRRRDAAWRRRRRGRARKRRRGRARKRRRRRRRALARNLGSLTASWLTPRVFGSRGEPRTAIYSSTPFGPGASRALPNLWSRLETRAGTKGPKTSTKSNFQFIFQSRPTFSNIQSFKHLNI